MQDCNTRMLTSVSDWKKAEMFEMKNNEFHDVTAVFRVLSKTCRLVFKATERSALCHHPNFKETSVGKKRSCHAPA